MFPKICEWAKYQNRHCSKSIWVTKLFFCQNYCLIRGSFWQNDSLVTHILYELCLFWYLAHSQILGNTLYMKKAVPTCIHQLINTYMFISFLENLLTTQLSTVWSVNDELSRNIPRGSRRYRGSLKIHHWRHTHYTYGLHNLIVLQTY